MKIEYVSKTDVGKKRGHNEDSHGVYSEENLFFVCDGMGGHAAGDYASQKVVETVIEVMKRYPSSELTELIAEQPSGVPFSGRQLVSMVMLANRRLFKLAIMYPDLRGMGTTFTSVKFEENYVNVVNVGDSRVYRLRNSKLTQLSVDHSWMEEMLQDGELHEKEADKFEQDNVITRAMGTDPKIKVDWKGCQVKKDDIYLLCSDGLNGEIDDNIISEILNNNKNNLKKAADELIRAANDAGGSDNITVILAKATEKVSGAPSMLMDEIITVEPTEENLKKLDSYIDKKFPPKKTRVPQGVQIKKTKFYENPVITGLLIFGLIFGIAVMINKPFSSEPDRDTSLEMRNLGDLAVRTSPSGAQVSLFLEDDLVERKSAPADFLSLDKGVYRVEIEDSGYEKETLNINLKSGDRKVERIVLTPQAELTLTTELSHGFEPSDNIYINGEPWEYYGSPLMVRQVGMIGKKINLNRSKEYTIKVGDSEKTIEIYEEQDKVGLKLKDGNIILER